MIADRAYRIGQDRPVQVHRLVAEGTLEDRIAALLETKREVADAVIGSGERWIAELSDTELTELVSLRATLVSGLTTGPDPAASESREFGRDWWGRAWLEALEQRARLDPDRLPRGLDYARSGAVADITFSPGEARARVRGRKSEPYQVRIRLFADDAVDRVLEAIAAENHTSQAGGEQSDGGFAWVAAVAEAEEVDKMTAAVQKPKAALLGVLKAHW